MDWDEWGIVAYLVAAVWAFFEGETFVLVAAAMGATTGLVDPWLLMGAVWLGSCAGDQTWFALGKRFGPRALERFPSSRRYADRATLLLERYGVLFVLSFRFLYGVRNVASAVCGIANMPWRRFTVLNFIAAGVWAGSFVAAGWFLGEWLGTEKLLWLLFGAAAAVLGVLVVRKLWQRRHRPVVAPK